MLNGLESAFVTALTGWGNKVSAYVVLSFVMLATLDLVYTVLMGTTEDSPPNMYAYLVKKILFIGIMCWFITNYTGFATQAKSKMISFVSKTFQSGNIGTPDDILAAGIKFIESAFEAAVQGMSDAGWGVSSTIQAALWGILYFVIGLFGLIVFVAFAFQLIMLNIEYYLIVLGALVFLPLSALGQGRNFLESCFRAIASCLAKIMAYYMIIGLAGKQINLGIEFIAAKTIGPVIEQLCVLAIVALFLSKIQGIASAIVTGQPSMDSGSIARLAATAATIATGTAAAAGTGFAAGAVAGAQGKGATANALLGALGGGIKNGFSSGVSTAHNMSERAHSGQSLWENGKAAFGEQSQRISSLFGGSESGTENPKSVYNEQNGKSDGNEGPEKDAAGGETTKEVPENGVMVGKEGEGTGDGRQEASIVVDNAQINVGNLTTNTGDTTNASELAGKDGPGNADSSETSTNSGLGRTLQDTGEERKDEESTKNAAGDTGKERETLLNGKPVSQ